MFSGKLTKPEDFIVREILDERFSRKYRRTCKGVEKMCGEHSLYLLQKKNMNTRDAINLIAKKLCISRGAIGYAGLKDKNAVSYQYITISKGPEKNLSFRDIALTFMRSIDRRLGRGDLIGNEFEITLHNCRNVQELPEKIKKIRQGIPNFFGPQRFGVLKNNHIKGRMIIHRRKLPENMGKEEAKFMLNAYQSFLFNEMLKQCVASGKIPDDLPIIGYGTEKTKEVRNILKKEKISPEDFRISELSIMCKGGVRQSVIRPDVSYKITGDNVFLHFSLPKGSYATVVLNAIGTVDSSEIRKVSVSCNLASN